MEAINAALRKSSETKLRRRDVREGILSTLPQVHGEIGHQMHTVLSAQYPEFVQPNEEHTRFMAQSSQANHSRYHERKEELPDPRSSQDYVQWLERKGCFIDEVFMNDSLKGKAGCKQIQSTSRILMKLADELVYLRPHNKSHLSYDINMRHWRMYWNELIAEMKTVHPDTSPSGVYVLTTWPYSEFLTTLALRLCDMINSI